MGLFGLFGDAVDIGISYAEAQNIINESFQEALAIMEDMCANEGQTTVYNSYVVPAFQEAKGPIDDGWQDVDIGDYMDFMGEIVDEGNSIMADAYDAAQEILSELEAG